MKILKDSVISLYDKLNPLADRLQGCNYVAFISGETFKFTVDSTFSFDNLKDLFPVDDLAYSNFSLIKFIDAKKEIDECIGFDNDEAHLFSPDGFELTKDKLKKMLSDQKEYWEIVFSFMPSSIKKVYKLDN